MAETIKRVSYAYNSTLDTPYFLDVLVSQDGVTLVDVHETFKKKADFDEMVRDVVNLLQESKEGLV